jgi:HPt (histidine-containing phosphotransfer) domain-containing protein
MDDSKRYDSGTPAAGPVYNRVEALRRLRGSVDLLHDMARFFHEDSPKLLSQLKGALDEGDCRVVRRVAHTLRGLVATFDAYAAMEAAERLETLAQQNDFPNLTDAARGLEAEVHRLAQVLEKEESFAQSLSN